MFFGPYEVLSFLIKRLTLHPGDVITLGSPDIPGLVEPSEEMAQWYEVIGILRNTVTDSGSPQLSRGGGG